MLVERLQQRVQRVCERSAGIERRPRVVLLEWIDPPFSSGHWSPELVRMAGGEERIGVAGSRSRTTNWSDIVQADLKYWSSPVAGSMSRARLRTSRRWSAYRVLPSCRASAISRCMWSMATHTSVVLAHGWWTVWRFWLICCIPICTHSHQG